METSDVFAQALQQMLDLQNQWFRRRDNLSPEERKTRFKVCCDAERSVDRLLVDPKHRHHPLNDLARSVRDRQVRYWRGDRDKNVLKECRDLERELKRCLKELRSPQLALLATITAQPAPTVGYGR